MKTLLQKSRIIGFKLIVIFSLFSPLGTLGQEFNVRMNVTSCSTFTVQMQCVDNTYLPQNNDAIYGMTIAFASTNSFTLSVGSSSNGFSIGGMATATQSGYNVVTFSEQGVGPISTTFSLNTWYDVAAFTITAGTTNIILTSTTETASYYSDFICDSYFLGNELGVATNNGGLSKRWEGGTSTAWATASNWCPASVPSTGETVTIIDQTNDPVLSASVSLGSIEIQSGAKVTLGSNTLTIAGALSGTGQIIGSSTSNITFNGSSASTLRMDQTTPDTTNLLNNLIVNTSGGITIGSACGVIGILTPTAGQITTGGNLTIRATSASVYGQINPTGAGTFSGNITVEKGLSNTNPGWRQFGLPVMATLADMDDIDLLGTAHGTSSERNVKYWDAEPVSGNTAPGWTIPALTSDNTRGYSVYSANSVIGLHDISSVFSVTGTVVSSQAFDVYNSEPVGSGGSDDNGWNLIANPFATNLDVSTLWTMLNGIGYQAIHVYDQMNDQYRAITNGVSIIGSATSSSSTKIAPFQAFWVKSNSNTQLTLTSAHQTTGAGSLGTFMKKEYDLARLDVYTADSGWDQTVIYFDVNGNPGLDNGLDAYKLFSFNPETPNLYSVDPEGNYSINALSSDMYIHSVPLGFRSSKTGEMSFSLNTTELDEQWFVYLEDKQLGIFYNIKENPYSFTHTQNSDSRFVLHFQTYALSAEKLVADVQKMKIGGDGDEVYVFVPAFYKDQNYQLEVIDMAGRVVYTDNKLALTHGMNTLNLNLNANAYYAVRIKAAEGIESGKVQIR